MRPDYAALSDRGLVRASNEDRLFTDPNRGIYIVADGMGGHPGGAVAAQLVIDHLPDLLAQRLDGIDTLDGDAAGQAVRSAITELSATVRHSPDGPPGMGATLVLACIHGTDALIASLGDSRAYLLHQGRLQRLTTDHTLAELMVHSGDLTAEEAANHPTRNQLTRYVGMQGDATPETRVVPLASGDRLLLCTDGLSSMIDGEDIEAILLDHPHAEVACRELIATANAAGGTDNLTVITIDYHHEDTASSVRRGAAPTAGHCSENS